MLEYSLRERLGCGEGGMAGRPCLLAEHLYASKADREKWCELLFERFGAAGAFMSRAGVLELYANARTTGIAVDMGAGGTQITPVQEGYALMSGARVHAVGGSLLDACIAEQLAQAGVRIDPRLPRPPAASSVAVAAASSVADHAHTSAAAATAGARPHASLRAWSAACAVSELKHRLYRVADAALEGGMLGETVAPAVPYELPDGTVISVGAERLGVPELLFDPSPLRARPTAFVTDIPGSRPQLAAAGDAGDAPGSAPPPSRAGGARGLPYGSLLSLPDALASAAMACEPDMRLPLVGGLVLTGGASGLQGLQERLARAFAAVAPIGTRPKWAAASREERCLGAWVGGSILASLSGYTELWLTKAEYAEHGAKSECGAGRGAGCLATALHDRAPP